ncbi:hypothetical protein [Streptomyces monomycini]|uniref:hypothetical protein n=1 Tax=Streptomyces monomycini TaxID=371720 RepID=UPI0004AAE4AC|nr:hypothetical protein [Streptomyces monomycini]
MKIIRIAAAVAAAALAPSLVLATPALADSAQRTSASAPAAEAEQMPVVMQFHDMPSTFTAGGDWSEFSLSMENRYDFPFPITMYWSHIVFHTSRSADQLRFGDAELQYFAGGEWHPLVAEYGDHRFTTHICPRENPIPADNPHYTQWQNCPAPIDAVQPGGTHTLKLRMRFAASAPATRIVAVANDHVSHPSGELSTTWFPNRARFSIVPAEKSVQQ